ncbi:IS66 family transposase [bacterium]|nr:IS66 family transposase [bacterium]
MTQQEIVSLLVFHQDITRLHVSLEQKYEEVRQQLDWLKRQLFGAKSERHIPLDQSRQLTLGEMAVSEAPEASAIEVPAHRRRVAHSGTPDEGDLRFDESVPVQRIELPCGIAEDEIENWEKIGEKTDRLLAQTPGVYFIKEIVRPVYKKKAGGEAIEDEIVCALPLWTVFHRSFADVSLLAGLLVDKFRYHLPLYRQHQRMAACGVHIGRGSLTNWVHRTCDLLVPVYEAQLRSVLSSDVLAMDETPIKAGRKKNKPPGKGRMSTAYFWPLYGDQDEVAFHFAPSRAHTVVNDLLSGFSGTLVTDGYDAYDKYAARNQAVRHAACWVHARRGFEKALASDREFAVQALDRIAALYEAEQKLRSLAPDKHLARRAVHCKPLVEDLFAWLRKLQAEQALLPTNPFAKAAAYALDREQALKVFLEDPAVPLDTNHLERQIRPIAIGRKNWMFCWTEVGAKYTGVTQSLISTCVLHGIDPFTYLVDVLQRLDTHPAAKVSELTPRLWKQKFGDNPIPASLPEGSSIRR